MTFETVRIASTPEEVVPQIAVTSTGPVVAWAQEDGVYVARQDTQWRATRIREGAAGVRIAAAGDRLWALWDAGGTLHCATSYSEDGVRLEAALLDGNKLVVEEVATQLWIHCYGHGYAVAIDPQGEPRVAYVVRDRVWQVRRTGGTWTAEKGPLAERETIAFTIDARGRSHVLYVRDGILRHACHDGGRWIETKLGNKYEARHASIATDRDCVAHVAYMNTSKSKDQLWYARLDGGAFATELVDKKGNAGFGTRIAIDASGTPWIAYRVEHSRDNSATRRIVPADHRIAIRRGGTWQVETVTQGGFANDFALADRPYMVFSPDVRGSVAVAMGGAS